MIVKTYEELFGKKLTIRDLVKDFKENTKTGEVSAFNGDLNVRPPYQREFVYEIPKQIAVIDTILKEYPLNVMYWAKSDNGKYELMDGQQRTLSICKFLKDQYSVEIEIAGKKVLKTFSNLGSKTDSFLDYPLTVYICDGTEEEKLAWFRIINIAGVKLTEQEMRNAIHNGPWVTDAKRYFSRVDGEGYCSEGHTYNGHSYGDYLNVKGGEKSEDENAIVRQRLLEIVLEWAVDKYNKDNDKKETIDSYMDMHQKDANARDLWRYYEDVMEWVKETFPTYRKKEMQGVQWGLLYNEYHNKTPKDASELSDKIFEIAKDEISNPKGVYEAALSKDLKFIHARAFDKKDIAWAYKKQGGVCPYCHKKFEEKDMHGDHIKPWSKGGLTERENLQMLCTKCNIKKSAHDTKFNPWDGKVYQPFDLEKWDNGGYDENTMEIVD